MVITSSSHIAVVLTTGMSTEFNVVIFFLSFFRIVKSEMSHVAEKVRSKFIVFHQK